MERHALALVVFFAAAVLFPNDAEAQRSVVFGGGKTVRHLAEVAPDQVEPLQAIGLSDPAIGFEHEYFSLFFLDMWTGGGKVVLYDRGSRRQAELSDDDLTELTGRTAAQLGKPILYRFPLGWVVLLVVLGSGGYRTYRSMRELG